jgi:bifunctional DNA-binding transcriptional regulator/antitoxin component of YhaV-PrlF toxin-antitoxin module
MATGILDSEGRLKLPPEVIARLRLKPGDAVRVDIDASSAAVSLAQDAAEPGAEEAARHARFEEALDAVRAISSESTSPGLYWSDFEDSVDYVQAIRGEWEDRLRGLWGEEPIP